MSQKGLETQKNYPLNKKISSGAHGACRQTGTMKDR